MADEAQAKEEKKDAKTEAGGDAKADVAAPVAGTPEGDAAIAAAAAAKKKRLMLIASGVTAVIGIIVAVGVVFFMGGEKHESAKEEGTVEAAVVDVPEFTVNLLSEDDNATHFMKIKLAVEVTRKADEVSVNTLMPRLQDDWGGFMRQLRPNDMQGSAALQRLKEGLLRRANQSLAPVPVKAVYIRELLVQ